MRSLPCAMTGQILKYNCSLWFTTRVVVTLGDVAFQHLGAAAAMEFSIQIVEWWSDLKSKSEFFCMCLNSPMDDLNFFVGV